METAPLKSFATWARKELIREVTARIAVVLAPASVERVEQPRSVDALEKAVAAGGGGDKGRAAVADKVAYTWFNRIIALRFMDANGYTGVGVVSPQAGVETGQPEVLAEAKRGNIDTGVVAGKTGGIVTSLLNGTRRSDDAQGEAYALLLADYCRHWNRAMPFMFEREGDFTELVMPANLLVDDSVLSRAVKVLTEDVCQDVEVIGWLYQFYISERKDEVFAGFKKNKKAGADEIPAATQLFTPHWIVRYLVENSLGRLWMLNRPDSRLVDHMDYYIAPVDEETEFLKISRTEELKVVDPACGSGHMLTYAFDLLYAIYEEEGYAPAEIPGLILTNNLYGIEIDTRAGALAAFALTMKARSKQRTFFNKQVEPNVCVLDPISFTQDEIAFLLTRGGDKHAEAEFWNQFKDADTFGSLIQPDPELTVLLKRHIAQLDDRGDILLADVLDWAGRVIEQAEYLSPHYCVAITNPPYLGRVNMGSLLSSYVNVHLPLGKAGLDAAFIERCTRMVSRGGIIGMITMQSWMFKSTYSELRKTILELGIVTLAHLGPHAFEGQTGEVVSTCAFVLGQPTQSRPGGYIALSDLGSSEQKHAGALEALQERAEPLFHWCTPAELRMIPGAPVAYWVGARQRELYSEGSTLAKFGSVRKGMDTGNHDRFLRRWSEVSRSLVGNSRDGSIGAARWVPYNKGGSFRRWYGNQEYVILWENGGRAVKEQARADTRRATIRNERFYFTEGFTYSEASFGDFSARYTPGNAVFDSAGATIFSPSHLGAIGALVNTVVADLFFEFLCNGSHFQPGSVADLLVVPEILDGVLATWECVSIVKQNWDDHEESIDFQVSPLLSGGEMRLFLAASALMDRAASQARELATLESANNRAAIDIYGLRGVVEPVVPPEDVALTNNPLAARPEDFNRAIVTDLVSYAIGCVFGRYSLDEPGLILADQGATVQDYLAKVPKPTFAPDKDNVIPVVDGDWFEDDIVARFRTFLRVAFGEQYFEENLRFVTESLGVKDIRDYFVRSFYKDHVQRYKKRPIYWLFSSPKGSFNALIYMHRYTPSTVSTVLNEYLREFTAKLTSSLHQQERLAAGAGTPRQQAAAQKEADRLRKVLLELEEYERDVLYPLASRQLAIDLDDGVKANYPKFGTALKKIPGLEASDE